MDKDYEIIINSLLKQNTELRLKNENLYKRINTINDAKIYYLRQFEKMRKIISLIKDYFPEAYNFILHKCNDYWKDVILDNHYNDIFYL